jgi:hypothetical protein
MGGTGKGVDVPLGPMLANTRSPKVDNAPDPRYNYEVTHQTAPWPNYTASPLLPVRLPLV